MSRPATRARAPIAVIPIELFGAVALALASPSLARAQELLWRVDGTGAEQIGNTLALLADIDGDGRSEVIAGAPTGHLVRVLSGASGALLWEWNHTQPSKFFGAAVADAGDINGDGVEDVIVGAPGDWTSELGDVFVYSGFDGSTLWSLSGAHFGDRYGAAVCGLGDVDGDGFSDVAIGAPTVLTFGSGYDRVEVRSGATSGLIYSVPPTSFGDNIGASLALLDDLDGDGVRDFAAGAEAARYVKILSGKSGALLLKIQPAAAPFDLFGHSLAAVGDLDGDGLGDLLIGSPWRKVGTNGNAGAAEVYSTATGSLLQKHLGSATTYFLGYDVASAGDANGDGVLDLLVGSEDGHAALFSGKSGLLLYGFKGDPATLFGYGVAGGEDLDGDGLADVALGAPLTGSPQAGRVETRRGNDLYLDAEPFQPAVGSTLSLVLGEGTPGNLGLIALTAANGVPLFMAIAIAPLDSNGRLSLQGQIPPGSSGTSVDFLGAAISASGKLSVSATESVLIQ